MNVGLLWVPVSVYQMLRGALVLWVGLFSVLFLHRRLPIEQWASLFVVMLGVAVVGLSNSIGATHVERDPDEAAVDVGKAVIGALLVLFAQIFTASQFVIEEKILTRYSVEPLVRLLAFRASLWNFFPADARFSPVPSLLAANPAESRRSRRHLWLVDDSCPHAHPLFHYWPYRCRTRRVL